MLGRRLKSFTIMVTYTNEDPGLSWMNRLPRIAESARELEGSSNASSFSASRSENELEISPSEEWIPSDAVRDLSSHMQEVSPRPQVRSLGSRRRSKWCVNEISEHSARFTMANGAHEVKSEEFIAHQKQASGIINDSRRER